MGRHGGRRRRPHRSRAHGGGGALTAPTTPILDVEPGDAIEAGRGLIATLTAWAEGVLQAATSVGGFYQLLAITAAALAGWALSRRPSRRLRAHAAQPDTTPIRARLDLTFARAVGPLITVVLLWIATAAFGFAGLPIGGLRVAASLLNAWIVVRLVTGNMVSGTTARVVAVIAWTIAALYVLRLMDPIAASLQSADFRVAGTELTAWRVLTSLLIAVVAIWIGRNLGAVAQSSISSNRRLTPSMAGLLGQVARIVIVAIAFLFALNAFGFDLTALAVFTGALGVGIGLGLQTLFSNLASGVIILLEKSVKVGDFIELQSGVTGEVKEINIRSTLVTTNDSVDILVPNEEFTKAQVINWTLREAGRRLRVPFGVAYGTSKELTRQAGLEAAAEVQWTLTDKKARAAQVWMVGFGDSSLDYELVVWLKDEAVKRPAKVRADYYWALHSALERHGIEIPFPQRDLNIRQPAALQVVLDDERAVRERAGD